MKNQVLMCKTTYIIKYKPEQNDCMKEANYIARNLSSNYFKHEVSLVALDEYKPGSHGEDDFSRKQAWFYTYGDEDIKEEFKSGFLELLQENILEDGIDWDLITLYPTHVEGEVNSNLRDLMMDVASETDLNLEQVLKRNQTIRESHELDDEKAKVVNLEGSINVTRDIEEKNVIIVDNIALSGTSLLHGANRLKQQGAENVIALCIGSTIEEGTNSSRERTKARQSR